MIHEKEFTHLELGERDFEQLVFMNEPPCWDNPWLKGLCGKPLKFVAQQVIEKSYAQREDGATAIFANLRELASCSDGLSWFEKHKQISVHFYKKHSPAIWIRNIRDSEAIRLKNFGGSYVYYIDDGNTRALIYAVRLVCGEESFEPVKTIHATSWDFAEGILKFEPEKARNLNFYGEFRTYSHPDTKVTKRIKWNRATNEFSQGALRPTQ